MMTPWTLALSSTLVGLAVLLAAIAISLDAEASAWLACETLVLSPMTASTRA
jgi:hypothetical protein